MQASSCGGQMTLLLSVVLMLADTTIFGPTPDSVVTETQHTGEITEYGNIDSYFRNEFLKRWPQRNLYHFVGISRYWRGSAEILDAVEFCESLMCGD